MDDAERTDAGATTEAIATTEAQAEGKPLTEPAKRALAEAAERRRIAEAERAAGAKEIGGRNGPEPVRYGDWEKGGIAWDF